MGKVRGTFEEFTGHVTTAEVPTGCSAVAAIAMNSVNTGNRMRDDDLRSDRFFDADRYPDMTFQGTDLTMHDGLLVLPESSLSAASHATSPWQSSSSASTRPDCT